MWLVYKATGAMLSEKREKGKIEDKRQWLQGQDKAIMSAAEAADGRYS